jgi:hypothetical protein
VTRGGGIVTARIRSSTFGKQTMSRKLCFMAGPPRFLVKSRSVAVAEQSSEVRQFFDGGHAWDPLAYFERGRIGSRP